MVEIQRSRSGKSSALVDELGLPTGSMVLKQRGKWGVSTRSFSRVNSKLLSRPTNIGSVVLSIFTDGCEKRGKVFSFPTSHTSSGLELQPSQRIL